ncbi:response regulator receiver modulated diguanylate cyclase [Malonomonas rubra DSM 5091]|uniref:diguanylate cyclase n=1 Tax=Malonomonas rubra DSM 5091 TaxID=1122189 RepID=A0A1M6BP05_MALRU|nr:diguanylate cyclase [Malonomonas rubra]SHI50268.1 response regulator receiver modulated diguanylate cyclase [Malonomonas rubra DSM 5091]
MVPSQSTVLVVDDELFFRKLYQDMLSGEDCRIEVCENGEKAIQRMQKGGIDLVLTDIVMPGKCGLEVLRAARLLPDSPEVILVTGYASIESAIQALKSGARDYLVKPFDPDELKHLVRTCLEQRRLLAENRHLKSQIELYQSGQSISSLIDLNRLLPQAVDALLRLVGATRGCAFLCKDGAEAQVSVLRNLRDDNCHQFVKELLPQLKNYLSFSSLRESGLSAGQIKSRDSYLLPLAEAGVVKGGLLLVDVPDGLEGRAPVADLHYLCEQIALGFENACRFEDAQELMYTDDLTGLYNHRYMQVALEQEIRRSQRYGLQFSLLFLDLDHFKDINDQYGHLAGSAALQEVGQLLRGCVRDVDTLFRFGGDEFAAMLVETDGRTANIVAERIRKTIEEHVFLATQELDSRLTVTAGYATFPTDAVEKDALLDLADRAMYAGKDQRNVVHGVESLDD